MITPINKPGNNMGVINFDDDIFNQTGLFTSALSVDDDDLDDDDDVDDDDDLDDVDEIDVDEPDEVVGDPVVDDTDLDEDLDLDEDDDDDDDDI